MKLGVNAITDEAREKFQELGVRCIRIAPTPSSIYWEIYTEPYDLAEQAWRNGPWDWLEFPGNKKEYQSQAFRVWKNPDTEVYYLYIKGTVFRKFSKITKDYRFTPPTIFTTDIIDYDPGDDSFRDKLLAIEPMAQSMKFQ